ncbi:hypothetical protein ACTHGU_18605 [Chitinophagaceae bacterium MMS25-I14]
MIAINFRNRHYPEGHPWRPYFIPGLTVKVAGAVVIGLIYQYYYGGGDTAYYFFQSKVVNSSFSESPVKWFNLLFHIPQWYDPQYTQYTSQMEWYLKLSTYLVIAVTAFLGVFCFNTFLPISVLFAALSFTGIWALFRTFASQYPKITKPVALAALFIPSTFLWGSGIFKDTICMFALGWLTYGVFRLLIQRQFSLKNIMLTVLSFYLLAQVKIYILLAFLPALSLWILFSYSHKIGSGLVRFVLKVGVFGIAALGFMYFSSSFASEMAQYSLENVAKTSTLTREWIQYSSGDEGSAYDLGDFSPSLGSMVAMFPKAVNVTLFRPYVWESRKIIVLSNAIEALLFLFFTLKILITLGPIKVWRAISGDPNIQFCLIFTLIFAFAVGISSGNFGSLSRYRIPCLPLYGLALILIYYKYNDPEKPFFRFR